MILDEAAPDIPRRVRVMIEELPEAQMATSFLVKLQAIRQALAESGYQPRSKKAMDTQIREERDSWGE